MNEVFSVVIGAVLTAILGACGFLLKKIFDIKDENESLKNKINLLEIDKDSRKKCRNCNSFMTAKTHYDFFVSHVGNHANTTEFFCEKCKSKITEYEKAIKS